MKIVLIFLLFILISFGGILYTFNHDTVYKFNNVIYSDCYLSCKELMQEIPCLSVIPSFSSNQTNNNFSSNCECILENCNIFSEVLR